ncbi:hypothetical protein [Francisella frigiditurris]|uniref:Uncharacterized protein n=1 Tax=Francisella frigiditurris TaxID=1542390 RepID=A0A1J0KVC9_9GAMM|nr:hypothetical protein [Francisella frigiditurris]APC97651.1 hypothetical protein KX01_1505 [Francisella frigiditurris]
MSNCNFDNLPSICKSDVELRTFFNFFLSENKGRTYYSIEEGSHDNNSCHVAQNFLEENVLQLECFNKGLILNLFDFDKEATKKDIVRTILESIEGANAEKLRLDLLSYFSCLYSLNISRSFTESNNIDIVLSESDEESFIKILNKDSSDKLKQLNALTLSSGEGKPAKALEKIEFENFIELIIKAKSGIPFKGFIIDGVKFLPWAKTDYLGIKGTFSFSKRKMYIKQEIGDYYISSFSLDGDISTTDIKIENGDNHCIFTGFKNIFLYCNNLVDIAVEFQNCSLFQLEWLNCKFKEVPSFDEKSSIKNSVEINPETFKNLNSLRKTKEIGSLEFSRLAEFLNKNNAYIEAQQLHSCYLKKKAEETTNRGFKFWVCLYDLVNGCGTSLFKPIIGIFYCWFFAYFMFLFSSIKSISILYADKIDIYNIFSIAYSVKQAFLTTIPLLAAINKPNVTLLNDWGQITIYLLMIISYLLFFLVALQIRKLLKLKE